MLLQDRHHLRLFAALVLALLCCIGCLCACQKEDEPEAGNGSVQYDYNELAAVMDEISNYCENNDQREAEYIIYSYGLDICNLYIEVSMNSADQAAIDWFKENVCASDRITFIARERPVSLLNAVLTVGWDGPNGPPPS